MKVKKTNHALKIQYYCLLLFFCFTTKICLAQTYQTLPFEDGFENGILENHWIAYPNTTGSNGLVDVTTISGNNTSFGVQMGKTVDGGFTTNALDLHLNLNNQSNVKLSFDIYSYADETHVQDGIYFSSNGGDDFVKVLDFKPQLWCSYQYGQLPPLDVSKLINENGLTHSSFFVIRFQQHDNADFNISSDEDGFYLDNVNVYAQAPIYASIPFEEDFETGLFTDSWLWSFADDTAFPAQDVTIPQNLVALSPDVGNNSFFGVRMGKRCDGGFATNALDLFLNLSGQNSVKLEFDIYDYANESHVQDGLFFSDDGGANFVKVLELKPDLWCDYLYGALPPIDVSQLINENGLTHSSQFVMRFQQHDNADFNISGDEDGFYLDNVEIYSAPSVYSALPFSDNFNAGFFNSSWQWRFADDSSLPAEDVTIPFGLVTLTDGTGPDGSFAVRMGKTCDNTFNTANALDLQLDLSNQSFVKMEFDIYTYADETHFQDGLYFSDDAGANFVKVLDFDPDIWCNYLYGQFPPIDVSQLIVANGLTHSSQFVIRFQQFDNADFNISGDEDGYYIDNVNVYSKPPVYAIPNFEDNFNNGTLSDSWLWSFADNTSAPAPDVTTPLGLIQLVDGIGPDGSFALRMGKRCDSGFSSNALDLFLNLSGQSDIKLEFDFYDYADETHFQDGLYFSDNAGLDFIKVLDFKPELWCSYSYGQFPPIDVSKIITDNGLTHSDEFVIRFQQHDNADFNISGDEDGYYIDNVKVYSKPDVYATLPFSDNFNSGVFDPSWQWRFGDSTSMPAENVTIPSGLVGLFDGTGPDGSFSCAIGKRCDENLSTNALDLHLDLSNNINCGDITLQFDLSDYNDENHIQDGIFFSNDGGLTFQLIYAFLPETYASFVYQTFELNLNELTDNVGLDLTSTCVIRFQQYDNSDFNIGGDEDGFNIDNVSVFSAITNTLVETVSICNGESYMGYNQTGTYMDTLSSNMDCDTFYTLNLTVGNPILNSNSNIMADLNNTTTGEGSIEVSINGGNAPYSYNWSNGSTNNPTTGLLAGLYDLTVTDADGCTETFNFEVPLDIIERLTTVEKPKILELYPNPATELIHIKWLDQELKTTDLVLVNAIGQQIRLESTVTTLDQSTFDISQLSAGLWFIKASNSNSQFTSKFIKL